MQLVKREVEKLSITEENSWQFLIDTFFFKHTRSSYIHNLFLSINSQRFTCIFTLYARNRNLRSGIFTCFHHPISSVFLLLACYFFNFFFYFSYASMSTSVSLLNVVHLFFFHYYLIKLVYGTSYLFFVLLLNSVPKYLIFNSLIFI